MMEVCIFLQQFLWFTRPVFICSNRYVLFCLYNIGTSILKEFWAFDFFLTWSKYLMFHLSDHAKIYTQCNYVSDCLYDYKEMTVIKSSCFGAGLARTRATDFKIQRDIGVSFARETLRKQNDSTAMATTCERGWCGIGIARAMETTPMPLKEASGKTKTSLQGRQTEHGCHLYTYGVL